MTVSAKLWLTDILQKQTDLCGSSRGRVAAPAQPTPQPARGRHPPQEAQHT